jgi:UDP-N-acetylmuramyl pentapeptide phosphotransferase/UDP-N-acetylglucosamine-1-phosphate transferase
LHDLAGVVMPTDTKQRVMIQMQGGLAIVVALAILATAALLSAFLIIALRPLLARYAMAQPNKRSSHEIPTPQGGGIAVVAATIAVSGCVAFFSTAASALPLALVFAGAVLIAAVGALADKHPVDVAPRLVLQTFAVVIVLFALPPDLRLLPVLPWWCERIALIIGGLWFVNLVNFMDGLDWMTVVEVVPITAALTAIGFLGILPWQEIVLSLALCGAMIGFAFFNRPVATLFLGDVGSLPIGLLLGWLLLLLAGSGGRSAAVLLPLYYLADSTITLIRRAIKGEPVWQAHRSHFYQRATDRGFSVIEVVARVFVVNVILAALALATVLLPGKLSAVIALVLGTLFVAWLLVTFTRGKR